MTLAGAPVDPLAQPLLAARLFLVAPQALGGLSLRGSGPARDLVLDVLRQFLPADKPWRRLPGHIDDGRLMGGIDIPASLAAGRPIQQAGVLNETGSGMLVVPMAERMSDTVAGRLAQAIDLGADSERFALVLLDDALEADERPPACLTDRIALLCDLSGVERLSNHAATYPAAVAFGAVADLTERDRTLLTGVAAALGIASLRPLLFADIAARAHAALHGRSTVEQADLDAAAILVLAPRATQLPVETSPEAQSPYPEAPQDRNSNEPDSDQARSDAELAEQVLQAALAAIPPDIMGQIGAGRVRRGASGGQSGKRTRSLRRGKPLGARPGLPRDGARLALIDTLRAAVPWQPLRRRDSTAPPDRRLLVRKDDLRVRRFEERAGIVTVFCVDASGSAAMARLAEAKGAVELILAQAYVTRSEVALIAFRGEGADLLLPPTRSLTRARRALAGLPGGGGTPLAAGLITARQVAGLVKARGATPFIVMLTDGSANIAADGSPGRAQAREDALTAARALGAEQIDALVIDISPRPRLEAEQIAHALRARYLPLPQADAKAIERVVMAARPEAVSA